MFIVLDARPLLQSFQPYTTGRLQDKYGCQTLLGLSPLGFQHEDVGLHDDKSEPDWLQRGSPSRTSKGKSWRPRHYVQQLPQGMRTELRRRLD